MQLKYSVDKNICNVIFKNKIDSSLNKQIERCKSDKKILFVYDKNISIAVTANQSLDQFTSPRSLEKEFKRSISRLYELTSKEYKL